MAVNSALGAPPDNGHADSDEEAEYVPPEVLAEAETYALDLLPLRSKPAYLRRYREFLDWCEVKKIKNSVNDAVTLTYFKFLHTQKKYNSATVWSVYSMLKSCFKTLKDKDLSKNYKSLAYLKQIHSNYKPRQSKTLTLQEVNRFCHEAPDKEFLLSKAFMAIGISGCLRKQELVNLTTDSIVDLDVKYLISVYRAKTKTEHTFTVIGNFYNIVKRYKEARPKQFTTDRFFLICRDGIFINRQAGAATLAAIPYNIATFLKLKDATQYTSHCVRRTSATAYIDSGADLTDLMRFGQWKSMGCARGYVDEHQTTKDKAALQITNAIMNSNASNASATVTSNSNDGPQPVCHDEKEIPDNSTTSAMSQSLAVPLSLTSSRNAEFVERFATDV